MTESCWNCWNCWTATGGSGPPPYPNSSPSRSPPGAPPIRRGREFAAVLARSLARHRVLCDLLSAQAGVLEHNVSADVAACYKRAALENVAALAALARQYLPELGGHADRFCAPAVMVSGAVWTHARPSAAMLAAYDADPSLAALRMDFTTTLEDMLTTLVAGTLASAQE
ncbi:hypothetical protein [Kitasatospora sp. NPDC058190]|uniref:hypothetical protein n=1 Tax=Kitasatospora sp. NPDC058190 TaxID=3346371 RepID=UPI0036DF669C